MPAKIKKRENGSYLLSVAIGYDEKGRQIVKELLFVHINLLIHQIGPTTNPLVWAALQCRPP